MINTVECPLRHCGNADELLAFVVRTGGDNKVIGGRKVTSCVLAKGSLNVGLEEEDA